MDDLMGKIGEVLSDDESKKQLSELLQMLISDENALCQIRFFPVRLALRSDSYSESVLARY